MDPITLVGATIGAGLACVGSYWLGRRQTGEALRALADEEDANRSLREELLGVRRLLGIEGVHDGLKSPALGAALDGLDRQLQGLETLKTVRVAGFYDDQGLPIVATDASDDALAAWVARVCATNMPEDGDDIEARDDLGNVFQACRLMRPLSDERPLWLGTWSVGSPVPRRVHSLVRHAVGGELPRLATTSGPASIAPAMTGPSPAADVVARLCHALPVQGVAITTAQGVIAQVGEPIAEDLQSRLLWLLRWMDLHDELGDVEVGFGQTLAIHRRQSTLGVHRFVTRERTWGALFLQLSPHAAFPWQRLPAWGGELAWSLAATPGAQAEVS